VVEAYHQGDLVWIHGFHLMLLPSFLRRDIPNCKVGMFFHTPFPSSELWLTLARREDLLRGILNADQVGFHIFEYARHFLSTCKRIVGTTNDLNAAGATTINVDGRIVTVTCIHIGVDLPRVEQALSDSSVEVNVLRWRNAMAGKIVIAGIDKLESIKGIPLKLSAIELFAERCPEWREKVVFAIIGLSAQERDTDYRETQKEVRFLIEMINEKYPGLVVFEERTEKDMGLKERLQFFAAADILLVIPPRDGLNRMPIEFTLARHRLGYILGGPPPPSVRQRTMTEGSITGIGNSTGNKNSEGLVIISEFVSTSRVMRGAIVVNPWRFDEVVNALKRALTMDSAECTLRMRKNVEFSSRLTTLHWAYHVLQDLKKVEKYENDKDVRSTMIGLGSTYRSVGIKSGFHQLDFSSCGKLYKNSAHRLILLDWGGTLVAEDDKLDKLQAYAVAQGHATRTGPSEELKRTLELLCADPKNTLFVVSGKKLDTVTEFFGSVSGIGLAAEHGSFFRMPQRAGEHAPHKWQTAMGLADQSWMAPAKIVMDNYTVRTHGTYVEQKGNALIWQFRDADAEFGFAQSRELEDNLQDILNGYPVDILRGGGVSDGYIEVRPLGVSKGHFLLHIVDALKNMRNKVDFIMCIGDDSSDEPMFQMLQQLPTKGVLMSKYAVAVGKKPTAATSYLDDPAQVMQLLTVLGKCTNQTMERKYMSAVNLHSAAPNSPTHKGRMMVRHTS
jgi:trehalose 6-phosphate synthase/phosphatase